MSKKKYSDDGEHFMAGLNRVSLIGNLGKDPEIRQTQSGIAVGNLSLGVTEKRKEGNDYKDYTEWVKVVIFGKTAENAQKYLTKGRQVFVEGRLQTRSYDDKTGQKRYTTEVVANQLLFLGNNQNQSSSFSRPEGHAMASDPFAQSQDDGAGFLSDEEIPF